MAFSLTECHWEMTYFWACPANVWNCHFQHFLGLVGLYWLQKKGILVLTGNRNFQSSQGKLFVFKNFILMEGMPISCTDRVVLRALLNALGTMCKKTLSGRAAPLLFWIKLELLGQQVRWSDSLNPSCCAKGTRWNFQLLFRKENHWHHSNILQFLKENWCAPPISSQ